MSKVKSRSSALAIALALMAAPHAKAEDYVVLVNAANDFVGSADDIKTALRTIFLKEKTSWPNGVDAIPLGPSAGDPAYETFVNTVLGMTPQEVEAHFIRLKQIKGETPPREVGSARILMRTVGKQEGAFGIATKADAADLAEGVRVLFEFSG
ncbi:MAG: hypothetical protein Tsb0010_18270 [Parvularculaceae bacterium]